MAELLPDGAPLDVLQPGDYAVTNPDTGLDRGTYLVSVTGTRTSSGLPFNQQIAYRIDTGVEYFRANISTDTATWTDWQSRSGGAADIPASTLVEKIDGYLASEAWRQPTDLSVTNQDADSLDITSSNGNDVTIPSATGADAGLMSAADKAALDTLASGDAQRLVVNYPALSNVNGHRIIAVDPDTGKVRHVDISTLADADRVVGLSLNAASPDDPVSILTVGVEEHAFGFDAGEAVFAAANGQLTQIPPAGAFYLRIGTALTSSRLLLQIEQPIVQA